MKIKAGIIGATGYAGAELVRILLTHPQAEIAAVSSVSFEGKKLSEVYPSYKSLCDMECSDQKTVVENNMGLVGTVMKEKLNAGCQITVQVGTGGNHAVDPEVAQLAGVTADL